jgi:hypothetical protein
VRSLRDCFQIPNQLGSLSFRGIELAGNIGTLVQALQQQQSLESLICVGNNSLTPADFSIVTLADFLLPRLYLKSMYGNYFSMSIPKKYKVAAAVSFARVTSLKSLTLGGLPGDESDLRDLFIAMHQQASLESVILMSQRNRLSEVNVRHVADMVRQNSSIKELHIHEPDTLSFVPIAMALETNSTLKKLSFFSCYPGPEELNEFLGVLENKNFMLEDLFLGYGGQDVEAKAPGVLQKIRFYLELNKDFQRKRLFSATEDATAEEWVNVM